MPSRASRLFGGSAPSSRSKQTHIAAAPAPQPTRTLVFSSPQTASADDLTTFAEFDFGFDKFADSIALAEPSLQLSFLSEQDTSPSRPRSGKTSPHWGFDTVVEEDEDEDDVEEDDAVEFPNYGSWEALMAVTVTVQDAGKPRIIDIRLRRSNSESSYSSHSTHSSRDISARQTVYPFDSPEHSKPSTAASSVSDLLSTSPTTELAKLKSESKALQSHSYSTVSPYQESKSRPTTRRTGSFTRPWYTVEPLKVQPKSHLRSQTSTSGPRR